MDIGKKIRNLRLHGNMRQEDLAKILGVSKSSMSNYERNYCSPPPDILKKIADYFHVSLDYLYDYDASHGLELIKESTDYNPADATVLSKDEWSVLHYYKRLRAENKDYIKGQMIQLYLKQTKGAKKDSSR